MSDIQNKDGKNGMKSLTVKQRIEFIDLAKGVCILLVICEHTDVFVDYPGLQSMRMPLFFVLSGLLFKDYGGFLNHIVRKTNTILIPFVLFYLVSYAAFYMFEWLVPGVIKTDATGIFDLFTQRQFFNGPLWFLLALFWTDLMFFAILQLAKREWLQIVLVASISSLGMLLSMCHLFLPCNIDSAMSALPFFYFGYLLKKSPLSYSNPYDKYNALWVLLFYGIALCIDCGFGNPRIVFPKNIIMGNWVFGIIVSISSVMAVLFLCKIIKRLPFISYFGKYSIIPLCVHHLIYRPLKLVLTQFDISGGGVFWLCQPFCYVGHVSPYASNSSLGLPPKKI